MAVSIDGLDMNQIETERNEENELDESMETPMNSTNELTEEELNEVIEQLCISKAEEFRLIGYEQVEGREIWDCVSEAYIKTGTPALHRIVNDILSLKVTRFMNWMTISAYKGAQF